MAVVSACLPTLRPVAQYAMSGLSSVKLRYTVKTSESALGLQIISTDNYHDANVSHDMDDSHDAVESHEADESHDGPSRDTSFSEVWRLEQAPQGQDVESAM